MTKATFSKKTKQILKTAYYQCGYCGWTGRNLRWTEIEPGYFDDACPCCKTNDFIHSNFN